MLCFIPGGIQVKLQEEDGFFGINLQVYSMAFCLEQGDTFLIGTNILLI